MSGWTKWSISTRNGRAFALEWLEPLGWNQWSIWPEYAIDSSSCKNYSPEAGDIAVIPNVEGGRPEGHIAMFTGKEWISDFKQRDMWGGPIYRKADPDVAIYRFPKDSK